MRVGVIGIGYVGKAVAECFAPHHEVVAWDAGDETPYPAEALSEADFAVVCVQTPASASGAADLTMVEAAVTALPCDRILLKSTVPPGTTDRLRAMIGKGICFWPEYIGESSYYNPHFPSSITDVPFVIVGGEPELRSWFIDKLTVVLGPTKQYFQCTAVEAEVAKYAENAFIATKVTFANEFRRIAETFGADWHTVREAWLLDPRMERMHTAAFGDDRGFDGKCLPKDVRAIVAAAAAEGYAAGLLEQVLESNERFRSLNAPSQPPAESMSA